jgi:hypothetical protein
MELTRRDALAALAASGIAVGGGAVDGSRRERAEDADAPAVDTETLVALATVLYPSDVDASADFVETYVLGRVEERAEYYDEMAAVLATLDERATEWYGDSFSALPVDDRDSLLRELGLESVDPDPGGTESERMRYYLVNELLYALFTTPAGGQLVGAENPTGHPGGLEAYQRGPNQ